MTDFAWHQQAACRSAPTALFFPEPGRPDNALLAEAKAFCAACPVAEPCLAAGVGEPYGIWGGLTVRERRALPRAKIGKVAA